MATARDIIRSAMLKIGALMKNEQPSSDEANDALSSLNALLGSWSNDSLTIYARTWSTFTLSSGTASYTIGSGGAFNAARPTDILDCYIRSGDIDYPMGVISDQAYNSISYKAIQGIPEFLNYDGGYPLGTIRLYPVPSANYSLFLLTETPLTSFASLDTELSMPPGVERALVYNLAIDIAPEYGQKVNALLLKTANESLGAIRIKNAQVRGMDAYPQNIAVRNIFSGWWY